MKSILSVVLPLVILGVFGVAIWYVAYRLNTLFALNHRWPLYLGVTLLFVVSLLGMVTGLRSTDGAIGAFNTASGYLFGFFAFLLLSLLVLHVVQLIWNPAWQTSAWTVLAVAFGVTAAGALWANSVRVSKTVIPIEGLEQEVTILQLSDAHIGHQRGRNHLEKIVRKANRHKPDMVLITGDLVDAETALQPGVLSPLADLNAPTFYVRGNHENYVGPARIIHLIEEQGVRVLRNEVVETHGIYLMGLDYMRPDNKTFDPHPSSSKRTIENTLPTIPLKDDKPSVLMHHSPVGAEYVSAKGINLMIAGHTHGGQMFPGTLLAPLFFPFTKGLYSKGNTKVFVSQGAGTFGPRIRLGTANEINLLRLTPQQ